MRTSQRVQDRWCDAHNRSTSASTTTVVYCTRDAHTSRHV
jgi:hypothetical protein